MSVSSQQIQIAQNLQSLHWACMSGMNLWLCIAFYTKSQFSLLQLRPLAILPYCWTIQQPQAVRKHKQNEAAGREPSEMHRHMNGLGPSAVKQKLVEWKAASGPAEEVLMPFSRWGSAGSSLQGPVLESSHPCISKHHCSFNKPRPFFRNIINH